MTGNSMAPTLQDGDTVTARTGNSNIAREDIVLIDRKHAQGRGVVKRVAGIPGDTIYLSRDRRQSVVKPPGADAGGRTADYQKLQLRRDEFWVLGDNPSISRDSRDYGRIRRQDIIGTIIDVNTRTRR